VVKTTKANFGDGVEGKRVESTGEDDAGYFQGDFT
jgi:hypothetical protein